MNENQQDSPSAQTAADLLAQLTDLEPDAALSYLNSRRLATAETAAVLVSAALEQAESAARAAGQWLYLAAQLNLQSGNLPALDAQILYAQARLHLQLGDLQEAESAIYRAQSFWQKLADNAALARSYLGLTQILALQGRFDAAENAIQQAIDLLPPDSMQRAWAYTNLANLLDRRGKYAQALTGYEQAQHLLLRLRRQAQAEEAEQIDGELAELQLNRANVLVALDRPDEAEDAYTYALEYFVQRQDVMQQGRLTCNLGSLYLRTGRYADALRAFDTAEESLLGEHLLTVESDAAQLRVADILLLDQANAYLALNLHNEAVITLERCQKLFRSADQPYELAQSLYLLGLLHLRHHDLETGQRCLRESYQLFHTLDNQPWRNRAELALAEVDVQGDRSAAAATRLDQLLNSLSRATTNGSEIGASDLSTTVEASLLRLQLHLHQQEFSAAQQIADQIDALLATLPLPHLRQRLTFARGSIALAQQQFDTARSHFYTALHLLEDQRMSLPLEEFRTAYLADKYHIHAGLVLSLLHEDAPTAEALTEAFKVIERARARSLHERLQSTLSRRSGTENQQDKAVEAGVADEQGEPLYEKLHWFYNQIFETDTNQPDLRQELQHYESLLERMSWKSAQPQDGLTDQLTMQPHIASLSEFQQSLGEDQQALLYYIVQPSPHSFGSQQNQGEVLAFLVEREQVHLYRHLCTPAQLTRAQAELRFQMGRVELGAAYLERHRQRLTGALRAALHELYTLLIAPLASALRAPRLLLVPYGPLHLLPFHALWDGERHLIECFTCSYAPSASVTVHFTERDQEAGAYQSFAGLALNDPAIPQAKREVELAAQAFPRRHLYLDEAGSRAGLSQAAAQADILHIATHGLFRPDNPFFSSLKLADGWIDVRALYRLPLTARLVVLSACDSGSGEIRGGDEVIGLARGFLGAGAKDLVVSLWNVHDARAVEFMSLFYQHLTAGATPAAALQSAQCRFIRQGDHAYYWASFLAIGA